MTLDVGFGVDGKGLLQFIDDAAAYWHKSFSNVGVGIDDAIKKVAKGAKQAAEQTAESQIAAAKKAQDFVTQIAATNATKRQALAGKEFKELETQYMLMRTTRQDIEAAITQSTDKELTKRLQAQKKELAEELKLVRDEYTKRDEVVHGGQGAKNGILGLGREAIGGMKEQMAALAQSAAASAGPLGGVVSSLASMGPLGMAAAAGAAVLTAGIVKSIQIGKEYEDSLADLRAITGLTGEQTTQLGDKARQMAKDFGMSAVGGVEAFKLVISALGPDIAKDQDALNEMGRDVSTLAKASGIEAKDAVNSLTVTMSQFGFSTLAPKQQAAEMTRIMNVMAAGAKEGAAEVPDLAESMKVVGTVAKQSGVSVEGTVAAIEAMSQAGIKGGEAGTGLRNVLLSMSAGSNESQKALKSMGLTFDDINPAKVGLTKGLATLQEHLKNVHDPGSRAAIMMSVFGKENLAAANILAGNSAQIEDLTKKVTGTNEATEQANIKQATFSESMKRAQARLEDVAITVYQKIQPALNFLGGALANIIDVLITVGGVVADVVGFFFKLGEAIGKFLASYITPFFTWVGKIITQGYEWVKSLGFVQSIVQTVKNGIGAMVDTVMKAYTAVRGFLETVGVLEKKSEKPITIEAKVELPPDEAIDNGEGGPKFAKGKGAGAGKDVAKEAFDKAKAILEDQKKEELGIVKLAETRKEITVEESKIRQLELEEKYSLKIRDAARTHHQKLGEFTLQYETARTNLLKAHFESDKDVLQKQLDANQRVVEQDFEKGVIGNKVATKKKLDNELAYYVELRKEQEKYGIDTVETTQKIITSEINGHKAALEVFEDQEEDRQGGAIAAVKKRVEEEKETEAQAAVEIAKIKLETARAVAAEAQRQHLQGKRFVEDSIKAQKEVDKAQTALTKEQLKQQKELHKAHVELLKQYGAPAINAWHNMTNAATAGIKKMTSGWREMGGVGGGVLADLTDGLVDMGIKFIEEQVAMLAESLLTTTTATAAQTASMEIIKAEAVPAAAAVATATGGVAAATGGASLIAMLASVFGAFGMADGGFVGGSGGERDDKNWRKLSRTEFVVNGKQAPKWAPVLHAINSGADPFSAGGSDRTIRLDEAQVRRLERNTILSSQRMLLDNQRAKQQRSRARI